MIFKTIFNILIFSLKPKNLFIIIKKIYRRLNDTPNSISNDDLVNLYNIKKVDWKKLLISLDKKIYDETNIVCQSWQNKNDDILNKLEVNLGGGGFFQLLYFFTRKYKYEYILETGVGAGHSSLAILLAVEKNNKGKLFSSELSYFRLNNPKQYVGILVPNYLKKNWELFTDGDEFNLNLILKKTYKFDFIHYDSDKSYNGRKFFFNKIQNHINRNTIIIMDDIQDNSFFYDVVMKNNKYDYNIFQYQNKYIGMIKFK